MTRYLTILGTFARVCLVRDMTFRANFLLECLTSLGWMSMNLAFYLLVFTFTPEIGKGTGWTREPFFAFVATGLIINAIVQALFMPSAEELTEMVRTGGLDTVLVKPLDAQFLLSMHRFDFSSLANGIVGLVLLAWAVSRFETPPPAVAWAIYPLLILCGVAILYAFVIMLAAPLGFMGGFKIFSIELTRGYGSNEFREDLKKLYNTAGINGGVKRQQNLVEGRGDLSAVSWS